MNRKTNLNMQRTSIEVGDDRGDGGYCEDSNLGIDNLRDYPNNMLIDPWI